MLWILLTIAALCAGYWYMNRTRFKKSNSDVLPSQDPELRLNRAQQQEATFRALLAKRASSAELLDPPSSSHQPTKNPSTTLDPTTSSKRLSRSTSAANQHQAQPSRSRPAVPTPPAPPATPPTPAPSRPSIATGLSRSKRSVKPKPAPAIPSDSPETQRRRAWEAAQTDRLRRDLAERESNEQRENRRKREEEWRYRVMGGVVQAQQYENKTLQEQALKLIPHFKLMTRAQAILNEQHQQSTSSSSSSSSSSSQESAPSPSSRIPESPEPATAAAGPILVASGHPAVQDALARALVEWFPKEFFTFVSGNLPCACCGGRTTSQGVQPATGTEQHMGAQQTEIYICSQCPELSRETRFPRFNNAGTLLHTRRGRCGEFSQVFTLFARAMGYDARIVYDWTDHVWTEIYSGHQHRWIHYDPCEGVCDSPLMYEQGWNKDLSYIVAVSAAGAVDVTQRYTAHWSWCLTRRRLVSENFVTDCLRSLNAHLYTQLPKAQQSIVTQRRLDEREELRHLTEQQRRALRPEEKRARISGSAPTEAPSTTDTTPSGTPAAPGPQTER